MKTNNGTTRDGSEEEKFGQEGDQKKNVKGIKGKEMLNILKEGDNARDVVEGEMLQSKMNSITVARDVRQRRIIMNLS